MAKKRQTQSELRTLFEKSDGPTYYMLGDTSENWRGSETGEEIKEISPDKYILRNGERFTTISKRHFEDLMSDGFLAAPEELENVAVFTCAGCEGEFFEEQLRWCNPPNRPRDDAPFGQPYCESCYLKELRKNIQRGVK